MNLHSNSGMKRTAKDVINKAKNLQRLGEITYEDQSEGAQGFALLLFQLSSNPSSKNVGLHCCSLCFKMH